MTYNRDSSGSSNPTDEADLESALHSIGGDVDADLDDLDDEQDSIGEDADLDDLDDEQNFGDVPQEYTESYGTGVAEMPGYTIGGRTMLDRASELNEATPDITGGDIDANYEQANAVGDESVGGTAMTPDMSVVDDLGRAVGLDMDDYNYLHTTEILEGRDDRRWELEPKSSEDYADRRLDEDDV